MNKALYLTFAVSCFLGLNTKAQVLKPGFDWPEYIDLMHISAHFGGPEYYQEIGASNRSTLVYTSPVVGLNNKWELWMRDDNVAIISIRGTTEKPESWLANFYAAMVPAAGTIEIAKNDPFNYELSANPKAAVHVGWLISMGHLVKDILPKIDSCYQKGVKDVLIIGHSQGGGIAYMLTSYLLNLQSKQVLPVDIRFKTYGSASPKPGNLYYAYDYESKTRGAWAFNVVNMADWVPEVPMSIQTLDDFNATNPFIGAKSMIKKLKFPNNLALKHVYNQLDRPTRKAQKRHKKYLGKMASKAVKNNIPGYEPPKDYYNSNHYVRTGNTIVLKPDGAYFDTFPAQSDEIFKHHFHPPYLMLATRMAAEDFPVSDAKYELVEMNNNEDMFAAFSERMPTIIFSPLEGKLSGNSGCNQYFGTFHHQGALLQLDVKGSTRMFCQGVPEVEFFDLLKQVDGYQLSPGNQLMLTSRGAVLLIFEKNRH